MKKDKSNVLIIAVFFIGLSILLYPIVSNWWNELRQSRAIMDYETAVSQISLADYEKMLSEAKKYNEMIAEEGMQWVMDDDQREHYNNILNVDGTGNMGYISIPKINVNLPLYHGVSEEVLLTSIGHIEGTSFPVGGETSHSVVSGHRGLPSSKLFSELDKLSEGDRWTVSILNETFTYQVDQIKVVEPDDLQFIQLEDGQDYMTLVTCTPYGINTHRLLIRGHRVENTDGNALVIAEAIQIQPIFIAPFIAAPLLIFLLVSFITITNKKLAEKRAEQEIRKNIMERDEK